ncbi:aminotransferase class III-fold pyridoxal phosphate-dependent enzyme, partial [Salmonella sp. s51228]|uniref:aminotransferase class III-fold pyridoxal phosphate-dependent enzyme n=1 Tax=Salmonella sp. s51228 TaxID=3159652 RepID=UPI0039814B1D
QIYTKLLRPIVLLTNARTLSSQVNPKPDILKTKTDEIIALEKHSVAHNYTPLSEVVFERAEGPFLWSVEGKRYFDFICGFSALNQGHRHPKIVAAMKEQVDKITLTGRALHTEVLSRYAEFATSLFRFDKLLPMTGGVEAAESA